MEWRLLPFAGLSSLEVHDILRLRADVFVVEQQSIYADVDGQDLTALHLLCTDDANRLRAYARILPPHGEGLPHIGRVVVHSEARGHGLGREVMRRALMALEVTYGSARSALAAQAYLEKFYEGFGYARIGEDYVWDGILHVDMERGDGPLSGKA